MRRIQMTPRDNWQTIVEKQGLTFHTRDTPYWNESACYAFSAREVDQLEEAGNNVHQLCIAAAQHIIDNNLFEKMAIKPFAAELIKQSWNKKDPHLYGRFDFVYNGFGDPKMIEYNADTPTSLLEAAVIQWYWMQDTFPSKDQFNSLHEQLIERWKHVASTKVHFTVGVESEEDVLTTTYLQDTAIQASLPTQYVEMAQIGYDSKSGLFVDADGGKIDLLFKLDPWEYFVTGEFAKHIPTAATQFVEPAWKMLWSNKAILPILWEIAPNHPNLLPAYFESGKIIGDYVKKPMLSREGANVAIHTALGEIKTDGAYGEEGYVYQAYAPIRAQDGKHPVLGLWMIGDECKGMGIRESDGPITGNLSRFVPHYFD